ncbi:AraC family transcriptional regulator [Chitinophaga rhizophila]|uniref:AraC family transcriptional regulator n=1 Tax=Chitinophaga rhizophila TaxID=2866212 RepID=A0ABS7GF64_9BACT|nr:AraC family transcriptional regulator [Chitinophaga rhizophila]MBW8685307.1 AraC family transcriptional regulator [Chitinophaga rhizophila]
MGTLQRRDGFEGEQLISLPEAVWRNAIKLNPVLSQLYITHIGYFPKAAFHYRDREKGCTDNILIYCVQGKGWYSVDNRIFHVGMNEYVIIPATDLPLRYGSDDEHPWTIYWVHFSSTDIHTFNQGFNIGVYDGPKPIHRNEKGIQLWKTMYESLQMGFGKDNLSKANLYLYHFVATFLYPDKPLHEREESSSRIQEAIRYMQQHLAATLTVEELAQLAGLSPSHFSALFKKTTGMSPLNYFIHLKLQQACLLLYTTNLKIKQVAVAIGYEDPYHFSRLFKKSMYVSPEQYRGMRRKDHDGMDCLVL